MELKRCLAVILSVSLVVGLHAEVNEDFIKNNEKALKIAAVAGASTLAVGGTLFGAYKLGETPTGKELRSRKSTLKKEVAKIKTSVKKLVRNKKVLDKLNKNIIDLDAMLIEEKAKAAEKINKKKVKKLENKIKAAGEEKVFLEYITVKDIEEADIDGRVLVFVLGRQEVLKKKANAILDKEIKTLIEGFKPKKKEKAVSKKKLTPKKKSKKVKPEEKKKGRRWLGLRAAAE